MAKKLKQHTADENILEAVDHVAFDQEDLERLLKSGASTIRLCGDFFAIPKEGVRADYEGVHAPVVELLFPLASTRERFAACPLW